MSARARAHAPAQRVRPTLVLRAVVWLRRPSLDRALAAGATDSELLRMRAGQLVKADKLARIADAIELAMADEATQACRSGAAPLQRVSITLAHAELVWLVAALRSTADPSPQAVAMALELVTDDAGPLYAPLSATALCNAARRISAQLLARSGVDVPPAQSG